MSQIPLRLLFRNSQPLRRHHHHHHHQEPRAFIQACRSITSGRPILRPLCRSRPATADSKSISPIRRPFSSSSAARATIVVQNPRVDDDGVDMSIEISERAAKRLRQITSSPAKKNTLVAPSSPSSQDSHLRVTVTSGGCHGFQYLMSLEDASKIDQEEDTIFAVDAGQGDGDGQGAGKVDGEAEVKAKGKAQVVMDLPSLELLKGSTVDFTTELIGSQFKIVGNPRATSSCGCGTSFDIQ